MAEEIERTRQELAEMKAMFKSKNLSPMISDKVSCEPKDVGETKPSFVKDLEPLMVDDDDGHVPIKATPPLNKVKILVYF